jgi:tRNA (guanine37-N1)-methyltransferase
LKKVAVITPVPDVINILIENSMLRKSIDNQVAQIHVINLREFGLGNYRQIDDTPFGGGSGMVMMAEPLMNAIENAMDLVGRSEEVKVLYPSPQGEVWDQRSAEGLSKWEKIIIICGHYKGIDERVIEKYVTDEYSIGDFIMTSGEIPAMIMLDSALRLVPGTLNNIDSALSDTFTLGLLDHPHYTQPRIVDGKSVPDILISGHHEKISSWRQDQREKRTKEKRLDLWKKYTKIRESENSNE